AVPPRPPPPPPPRAPPRPAPLTQPRHSEPAYHLHRRTRVPQRPVQQPLGPLRRPVTCPLRDRPPIPLRQLTDTAAVVRDRGIVGAGQKDDRVEARLPRS